MNKNRKKTIIRDPVRASAVKWVAKETGCSTAHVYDVISPHPKCSDGATVTKIKELYHYKYKQLKACLS